ncbi:Acetyltransferase (GNAT) domain-containing protein [Cribrihabitans marinus]|uniref:Acetyltransferase (GNAT) domain-containing protein n=1 Tax=Cribrihabitans marinus TaxID=1227549 RepID=A0A1H7BQJ2_9RHOB|nr:GNAT family N-acetyltransferase [Cribrihabitans marinus]GGH34579.1 hypothetical protein GCM10010973_27370 [Cribrihabitans marinus]SEJ76560.1 Acetyltransferase (GNAT) domain-containing protein [Cribrihabitans marinus]
MRNKRGISQAFSAPAAGLIIRQADVSDVFDMSRVLVSSIRELCASDHGGDPAVQDSWTANKTPERLRDWFTGGHEIWLAVLDGRTSGVGAVAPEGEVSVLYVAPGSARRGIGRQLLARLERELVQSGHAEARLVSTRTARPFYLSQGWHDAGAPELAFGLPGYPMRKSLHPRR